MGRCDRFDLQHVGSRAHLGRRDAHHGRIRLAVKDPVDVHRKVPFGRSANGVGRIARCERLVTERERDNFRRNCSVPQLFFNVNRLDSAIDLFDLLFREDGRESWTPRILFDDVDGLTVNGQIGGI